MIKLYKWYLNKKINMFIKLGIKVYINDLVTYNALSLLLNKGEYVLYKNTNGEGHINVNLELSFLSELNNTNFEIINNEYLDLTYELICDKLILVAGILPDVKIETVVTEEDTYIRLYKGD